LKTLELLKIEKQRNKPCDKTEITSEVPKIRTKVENLANFSKVIRIERNYLEFNFFLNFYTLLLFHIDPFLHMDQLKVL
jgi:hypothetical protein